MEYVITSCTGSPKRCDLGKCFDDSSNTLKRSSKKTNWTNGSSKLEESEVRLFVAFAMDAVCVFSSFLFRDRASRATEATSTGQDRSLSNRKIPSKVQLSPTLLSDCFISPRILTFLFPVTHKFFLCSSRHARYGFLFHLGGICLSTRKTTSSHHDESACITRSVGA